MTKLLFKNLLSPILVGIAVWIAGISLVKANPIDTQSTPAPATQAAPASTDATEQIERAKEANEIKPGDWAYQTLQNLSTKYSCSDAPNGKTLSREEFATSLNGCISSMEELVARRKPRRQIKRRRPVRPSVVTPPPAPEVTPPAPSVDTTPVTPPAPAVPEVTQQDLDQLKQLVQSFNTELQALDARLKTQDDKIATLEKQQFSTTTKLAGEAIFAITGLAGGPANATRNTIFSDRVRLNFRSSFTGKDLLLTRLQSRNSVSFAGNTTTSPALTNMTRLGFEGSEENATTIHRLQYQTPFGDSTKVFIEAVGSEFNDNYYTFNPEHQAAGTGSITRFGRFNPVYRLSNEGAGIGIDHKFSPNLGLVLSYAVPRVAIPGATGTAPETVNSPTSVAGNAGGSNSNGGGLFGGSNAIFSQLTLKPSEDFSLGLIYARSYHSAGTGISGNNGSNLANNPFGSSNTGAGLVPTTANHYSVAASFNLSKDLIFSAWGGLTQAQRASGVSGNADIWNYAATLAVKDFGSKGSTLGFVVGMQPKVTSRSIGGVAQSVNGDTSLHLEAFYKYKASDNLFITPGILVLTNPEHNSANPTEYLGTIRTTFVF